MQKQHTVENKSSVKEARENGELRKKARREQMERLRGKKISIDAAFVENADKLA